MAWATGHIEALAKGETVKFRPSGNSMSGVIESKQLVTVIPATFDQVYAGDIVLCKVKGSFYLHFVKSVGADGRRLIGNNKGHDNGWTKAIYGKCTKVEP